MNSRPSNKYPDDKQEYVANEGRTDYVVPKSRKANIIAYIFSLLAALILWGYVSVTEQANTVQSVFNAMSLEFKGESDLKDRYGLIVQSVSDEDLSITLKGSGKIGSSDIRLYVDLSEQNIDSAGTFELPVHAEVPDGFEYTLSSERIQVTIDKPDTKVFKVGSENVRLMGWILESGCTISQQTLNITEVTLEGNSANLNKVVGVEIRTEAIGMISNSRIVAAARVYLLDEAGLELDLPVTVRTDAPQGGIEVSMSVQREAVMNLTVGTQSDALNREGVLTLEPAAVRVVGDLEQVNRLLQAGSLQLRLPDSDYVTGGRLDESKLLTDLSLTGLTCELPAGMENIQITKEDGTPFEGATLTVTVSAIPTKTVTLNSFTLSDPEHFMTEPEASLDVIFRSAGDDALFEQFLTDLGHVTLYVDTDSYDSETGTAAVEVRISGTYNNAVYAVGRYRIALILLPTPSVTPDKY